MGLSFLFTNLIVLNTVCNSACGGKKYSGPGTVWIFFFFQRYSACSNGQRFNCLTLDLT